jgi:colanic acid biosynthesis glycosyl transferase WcaI
VKVAVVTAVYPPEPVVSSRTSADIANALAAAGDDVTVICPFPSRPAGEVYPGFRRRWRSVVREGGLSIVRCFSTVSKRSTLASRFAENLSFGVSAAAALRRLRGIDVLYLNTWPVFATGMAAAVARWKGIPYVISVQDVYPESLSVQGRSGAGLLRRFIRALDRWAAAGAASLIVLSEHFASIYRDDRKIDPARIGIVPNWIDEQTVLQDPAAGRAYRIARGIPEDAFVVGYGGNVGVAAAVEQLIEAWRFIDDPNVHLLVAGAGANLEACVALAREIAPERIHFHTPWLLAENTPVLAATDVLALPTLGDQSLVSVPSKLLSYLLAAKPVIAIVLPRSETAGIVGGAQAGWSVAPGDPAALAAVIVTASRTSASEREAMGERARGTCVASFGRERCVAAVLATLRQAARE